MDPHSRLSQFNHRQPRAGPLPTSRSMEPRITAAALEGFTKRTAANAAPRKNTLSSLSRPIVSNSRVRRDEKYRKDMYLAFVNNALQQKKQGNSETYDELVGQFNPKNFAGDAATPLSQLRLLISALSHVVSQLDRTHASLVDAVVSLHWTTMDSAFVKSYISFIGMLVSARPEYLSLVLRKIALGLTYDSGLQALNTRFAEGSSHPLTRRVVYDRLHNLLQHLLYLIPTLPTTLQSLLFHNFPHKRQSQTAQVTYIRNLLRISEYCPELSDRLMGLIIDRVMQIDVEIQVELEELDIEGEQEPGEVFELDPFDTVVGQDGNEDDSDDDDDKDDGGLSDLSSEEGDAGDDAKRPPGDLSLDVKHVQDMVNKLDSILKVVFNYFDRTYSDAPTAVKSSPSVSSGDSTPEPEASNRPPSPTIVEQKRVLRKARFLNLLAIFDRTIIRTFKSRYTQFLLFWYTSLDPEFSDLFQGLLISRALLDADQPSVIRAAAASYVGSFVSRAQFVDKVSTRRVVGLLCDFLANHLDIYDSSFTNPASPVLQSALHHTVFHAVAQAFFLIFCFRWRDLMEENEDGDDELGGAIAGRKWMRELNVIHRLVNSSLNPLKACSKNVVLQFARVAQSTGFVYCFSILEANKRSEYSSRNLTSPIGRSISDTSIMSSRSPIATRMPSAGLVIDVDLTTFFPFDPYKLPKSSSYIHGVYREWSSVAIDEDDGEGEEEDSEDEEESEEEGWGDNTESIRDDGTGGLGQSFNGMSISPVRPMQLVLAV